MKTALETMLPVIGEYRVHEVQSSHGVEEIERELHRRRLDALEAERRAEARRAEMRLFQEIEEKKRLNELENAIRAENQKLQQLGPRPIKKELPGIGMALWFAFMPIPLGWMVWLGSLNILDPKHETAGLFCILLLIGGYIAHKTSNKYEEEFDRLNKPFVPIDNRLHELRSELETHRIETGNEQDSNGFHIRTERMKECDVCGASFRFGPHVYEGIENQSYHIMVCVNCYNESFYAGGWAPYFESQITKNLIAKGAPIPQRNEKGLLPPGRIGSC